MCPLPKVTVPAWPAGDRHVTFTCASCRKPVVVLVENCEPGAVVEVGCEHKECAAVNSVQVRKAMFS